MFVGENMSKPVITVPQDMPINDALKLMQDKNIRRAPVMRKGEMIGIVSEKDLLNASPSPATSLSVWEITYLLSKITVKDVMSKEVVTVEENTPIETAARIMADGKVAGLPVMRGDEVIGMITETDLFKIFLDLMGARKHGVRATIQALDQPGELAKITQAIATNGGNFISLGTFYGEEPESRTITFKVEGLKEDKVRQILESVDEYVQDIRYC